MTLRPLKYRNLKTAVDGIVFSSQKEARRYVELKLLERAGEITNLVLQTRFPIVINGVKVCTYVADFGYQDQTGSQITEDVKGMLTPMYRLKKKLVLAVYGVSISEV